MSQIPPVLSLGELREPAVLDQLDQACQEWGVFYLSDHGLDDSLPMLSEARRFFSASAEHKNEVRRTRGNAWGYYDEERTKNTRDWKEIFDFGPESGAYVPQWPVWQPSLKMLGERHYAACEALAYELLAAISLNLGVADTALFHAFGSDHASFVRLNYFPLCARPEAPLGISTPVAGHLGVNHHTDAGALTLLITDDVSGLEVFADGAWREVPPLQDTLIVNLGDVVQVWSNDGYRAPLHRVRSQDRRTRLSIPFFFNPREAYDYAPLEQTGASGPARYRPINFGEFRRRRAYGDYADLGEEVQIDQYRLDPGEG